MKGLDGGATCQDKGRTAGGMLYSGTGRLDQGDQGAREPERKKGPLSYPREPFLFGRLAVYLREPS